MDTGASRGPRRDTPPRPDDEQEETPIMFLGFLMSVLAMEAACGVFGLIKAIHDAMR